MTRRRRMAFKSAPLTKRELIERETGVLPALKEPIGRFIVCSKCKTSGGTLVKVGDNQYAHKNQDLCRIMQLQKPRKGK
jgi:hypothetical protein